MGDRDEIFDDLASSRSGRYQDDDGNGVMSITGADAPDDSGTDRDAQTSRTVSKSLAAISSASASDME